MNDVSQRLSALGVVFERADGQELARLHPLLAPNLYGLRSDEDWRLSPRGARLALLDALQRRGVVSESRAISPREVGPSTVIATGAGTALAIAAPELTALSPVKGQILHFTTPPLSGATVRGPGVYIAPQLDGAVVGATMEPGRSDQSLEPSALARLRRAAAELFPSLAEAPAKGHAGVRAATPDGLPMVGRSKSGALLCVGARRNGWLLAPLVASTLVAVLAGSQPYA